ncbi:MAG: GAF domain-containing protein [Lentisphaerae bacterium]|nr:GAF domain-containing protein [Lentisphaerota bacterium]MCP4101260.1 GAF domain-containing protein [Lentisphaerota bacterium]
MYKNENIEIEVLNQISHVIVRQKNVSLLLKEVLDILYREIGLKRGTITLRRGNELYIEASHGLSDAEIKRGKYRIGEGITGQVALEHKPIIIPEISLEPGFLDRTQARASEREIAFICVPIIYEDNVIGTMSMDRVKSKNTDLQKDFNLLETVANIMADAVSVIFKEKEERDRLLEENRRLKLELDRNLRPANIVGNCSSMRSVYAMISQVADSMATVLIRGNSGTGKELVARAIHRASQRHSRPFIAVNCAALPENLIESELFGHEKGAFTGATARRTGRVEAADGGTIFLDEIGDLSQPMQVKLLRFLQERTFQRIGSNEERRVDVRILAATSLKLEEMMVESTFREDLYYRLNVFPIRLPDLKERRSDIMLLADYFLEKYNKLYNKSIKRISTPAINMMMAYHWPGNVRELENCVERAVLTANDDVIHGYNLPPSLQTGQATNTATIQNDINADFNTLVASFERELIVDALKLKRGNVAAVARHLRATTRIIHYKISKLNIEPDNYK